jgi:hypothetical protein
MTRPSVSDTRTGVFGFQCVASYQQLDAVGYVLLASAAEIRCDCGAVANASRACSKASHDLMRAL